MGAAWDVPNGASHKPVHPKGLPLSPNSASLLGSLHERAEEPGKAGLGVDGHSFSRCWMPRLLLTHAQLVPTSKFTSQTLGPGFCQLSVGFCFSFEDICCMAGRIDSSPKSNNQV